MTAQFFYVANWKMQKTIDQSMHFMHTYKDQLKSLASDPMIEIIFAPSFLCLAPVASLLHGSSIYLAGQNCSEYAFGPYTGQIDAASLEQVGCRYCIVGHRELRQYYDENNLTVANKVQQLLNVTVNPIICVGETDAEYKEGKSREVLTQQLKFVFEVLSSQMSPVSVWIAYEPVWTIGTGHAADIEYLTMILGWLRELTGLLPQHTFYLLYGGGVDEHNAESLRSIAHLDGFLIGSASLDFKKFEKIVSLTKRIT